MTTATVTATAARPMTNSLTAGKLPRGTVWWVLVGSWIIFGAIFAVLAASGASKDFNLVGAIFFGTVLFDVALFVLSLLVEGSRRAKDRLVTSLVATAFVIALLPLVSLLWTVVANGMARFDLTYFTESMRNVIGAGGGALHAIVGTLEVTGMAALISVPIGLLTSIYLVEYGRGHLARGITFLVDVMMGIPSIVAGLFAYALFALISGQPGIRSGFMGSVALSVLMIPVVVRSSEEILRLVPNELREASLALGVPKWLTVVKVVLPTSLAGITTGVMLSIARVIGETAPLLIVAGFTASMNYNLFSERMMTLPVFVYTQYANQGSPASAFLERAWTGALALIIIVMLLNLIGRIVARVFAPKYGR
jgi:phosphate transport system permease protein